MQQGRITPQNASQKEETHPGLLPKANCSNQPVLSTEVWDRMGTPGQHLPGGQLLPPDGLSPRDLPQAAAPAPAPHRGFVTRHHITEDGLLLHNCRTAVWKTGFLELACRKLFREWLRTQNKEGRMRLEDFTDPSTPQIQLISINSHRNTSCFKH